MKKRTLILLAVAAIAVGSVSSAFAYFTGEEKHTNAVTVGQNTTTITEKFDPPTTLKTGENTYKKTVQITNTGNTDTYVRVFLDIDDDAIRKITTFSGDNRISWHSPAEYKDHLPSGWVYIPESDGVLGGCYYYTAIVKPGESTAPLLTDVKTTFPDEASVKPYSILVHEESIQTYDKHGALFVGSDAWKAAWGEMLS